MSRTQWLANAHTAMVWVFPSLWASKGTRRYSDADLERIRQVVALVLTGVNQAGIEHILRLREQLADAEYRAQQTALTSENPDTDGSSA